MNKGEIIEVLVLDAADKAQTFAKTAEGESIFIQGPAAVGDRVKIKVFKKKRNRFHAKLVEVIDPSENRVDPICADFGTCGGCKWQHLSYAEQLRLKTKMVHDSLEHIGHFENPPVADALGAPEVYTYRNKADFSLTDMRWQSDEEVAQLENHGINVRQMNSEEAQEIDYEALGIKPLHFAIGFHAPGCHSKALDIEYCHLMTPEMNTVRDIVRTFVLKHELSVYSTYSHTGFLRNLVVREGGNSGDVMVNLITSTHRPELMKKLCDELIAGIGDKLTTFINGTTDRKNSVAFSDQEFVMHGNGRITDSLDQFTYEISANSFFQTNTKQAQVLYREIIKQADLKGDETVYDICCGTGSITLFAAPHCKKVLGLELIADSIRDAKANAERNNIENVEFLEMDMKNFQKQRGEIEAFGLPDVVITDPPRAGMHPKSVELLLELAPEKIVYVSCNPASLARDGHLFAAAGYTLQSVQPVDMFPQTNHIESVALFTK